MMRKTNRILNSAGSTTASQNGNTARRSITPIGLVAHPEPRLPAGRMAVKRPRPSATHIRNPYSTVKTASETSSMAMNRAVY